MKKVRLENVTYTAKFERRPDGASTNKNCGVVVKASDVVEIKNVTFTSASCPTPENWPNDTTNVRYMRYNGIEIGLNAGSKTYRPHRIDIENVNFEGSISNNGILIFDCADNAVINIKNCNFGNCSNPIRFSNYSMSKNVTINIENCKVNQWESRSNMEQWKGFLLLEDYRSDHKTVEDFAETFGKESGLKVNFKNVSNTEIGYTLNEYTQISKITGKQEDRDNQWIMACIDYSEEGYDNEVVPFEESRFPVITISGNPVVEVGSYDLLKKYFELGGKIKLTNDIEITKGLLLTGKLDIDMNGHKIFNESVEIWDNANFLWAVITVDGGELTLNGTGTIQSLENDAFGINVYGNGKVDVLGDINIVGNITAIQCDKGQVNIANGTYSIQQLANNVEDDKYRYMLNCIDKNFINGTAKFNVTGGKFIGFNPANNLAEGENTNFVAEGYVVNEAGTQNDLTIYEVVAEA